jgi:hypothetical protein
VVGVLAVTLWLTSITASSAQRVAATTGSDVRLVPVAPGWAGNSVNVVIFRRHSLTTHGQTQYIAFYDSEGKVVLGRRQLGSTDWQLVTTAYSGNVRDAHNSISIAVDGEGVLHMSWDHHNVPLRYCRARAPGSLELTEKLPMTGRRETRVTYPEFHNLPDGGLLFLYRDGASGAGNLVISRYDVKTRRWEQLRGNLIDGQGQRNAYWQAAVDRQGTIHLSWVWRESPDVASNHDLCYARSADGGKTWLNLRGEQYELPITASSAEVAVRIPQKHELMNQTSMTTDSKGRPYIATYWRPEGTDVPQYHLVHHDGQEWKVCQVGNRKTAFRLGGGGTKRVPISRPQILSDSSGDVERAYLIFRDEERDNRATIAICDDLSKPQWRLSDLTESSLGQWEPSYDHTRWQRDNVLNLFVQQVEQRDAEGVVETPARTVYVLEWTRR